MIVINDGSIDGSAKVLRDLASTLPRLRVVTHEHNRGYEGAPPSGFAAARRPWVLYTGGDGEVDPAEPRRPAHRRAGPTAARLNAVAIAASRVDLCTEADPERFFSYRRSTHRSEADYGRLLSVIMLAC